ncbi:MAG: hypothetical protein KBE47_07710, partial [Gemmiger sp.]|nr:hypothetical protein [Gemmiger sp.]
AHPIFYVDCIILSTYSASAAGQIILFCYPSVMIFANNIRMLIKMFFQLFCFTAGPQQKSARLLQGSVRALSCLFLCF